MSDRLRCCVPFCRRTTRPDRGFDEWLCGKHWQLVSRRLKLFKRRAETALRSAGIECEKIEREGYECAKEHKGGVHQTIVDRLEMAACRRMRKWRQACRAWDRCKREAIERAGGIG